ncbi:putative transcription factor TIFY family [Helianthus annuus]|nr:putative transcription factor TIFY family [Helianthus annuus]
MEELQSAVDGYHPQMHYMHNDLHPLSNGTMIHHVEGDADPGNMSDNHNGLLLFTRGSIEDTNQLTLSFQGQVYVFDSVSPEKDLSSTPRRLASLMRFREKRKERNFEKKIRYTVRKEVALRMQRNKGQFTSSKPVHEDSTSAATSWDSNQSWHSDGNGFQHQETVCRHCGVNEKSTPMMRKGPDGPKSLCNACGLMWANKVMPKLPFLLMLVMPALHSC